MTIQTSPTVRGIGAAVFFDWCEAHYELAIRFWKWTVLIPLREAQCGRHELFGIGIGWNQNGLLINFGTYQRYPEVKP